MFKSAGILSAAVVSAISAILGVGALDRRTDVAEAAPVRPDVAVAPTPTDPPVSASVAKSADGHYWAEAAVNGRRVRFLVDTGATTVALTQADARRLGVRVADADFDQPVATASGQTQAARVTLASVSVAGARVEDVQALVLKDGLETSLLGMSYLGRLSQFEATRDALILRP